MKIRLTLMMVCVCGLLAVPVLAALDAPENVAIDEDTGEVTWDPVTGADKYSIDVAGTVTIGEETYSIELSYSSTTPPVTIDPDDVVDALIAAGADLTGVESFDVTVVAKVKGLNPGKGRGRQNNPFGVSDPVTLTVDLAAE